MASSHSMASSVQTSQPTTQWSRSWCLLCSVSICVASSNAICALNTHNPARENNANRTDVRGNRTGVRREQTFARTDVRPKRTDVRTNRCSTRQAAPREAMRRPGLPMQPQTSRQQTRLTVPKESDGTAGLHYCFKDSWRKASTRSAPLERAEPGLSASGPRDGASPSIAISTMLRFRLIIE